MMIIGMGLANLEPKDINWKTVIWGNVLCFVLWPLIAVSLVAVDAAFYIYWQREKPEFSG